MLNKLAACGLTGTDLNWFKNYLLGRKQFVQIGEVKSELLDCSCGVPQGSVLGPILFIIYINSIQNLTLIGKPILYADTNLYYTGKDFDEIVQNMQIDLRCMMGWLERERLILNVNKTVFMCFSKSLLTIAVSDLKVDGHLVKRVSTNKFLGLHLTENLSWELHIKSIIKSIIPVCRAIFRTRHYLTFQMKRIF